MAVGPVAASKKTIFGDELMPKTAVRAGTLTASISPVDTDSTANAKFALY